MKMKIYIGVVVIVVGLVGIVIGNILSVKLMKDQVCVVFYEQCVNSSVYVLKVSNIDDLLYCNCCSIDLMVVVFYNDSYMLFIDVVKYEVVLDKYKYYN